MPLNNLSDVFAAVRRAGVLFKSASLPTANGGLFSYWASGGIPVAGSNPGNTTTGSIPNRSTTGAMDCPQPSAGNRQYIVGAVVQGEIPTVLWLYDRIWHAGAFSLPAGDVAGFTGLAVTRPFSGDGAEIWIEVTSLIGATRTITLTYVNQDGVGGRTATASLPAAFGAQRAVRAALEAPDTGVQQITNINCSAATTGGFNVVLARPLLRLLTRPGERQAQFGLGATGLRGIEFDACLFVIAFHPGAPTSAPYLGVTIDCAEG